jgi:hypothetical protein
VTQPTGQLRDEVIRIAEDAARKAVEAERARILIGVERELIICGRSHLDTSDLEDALHAVRRVVSPEAA